MHPDLFEHVADGVLLTDAAGVVRELNPSAERLCGRSAARAVGHPVEEVFAEAPALAALARRALNEAGPIAHDGIALGNVPVDAMASPIPGDGVVLSLRDRSISRMLAGDARATERIESLATVAAGIAHEVKNPLGGIRGAAQLLARKAPAESKELLEVIVREVDRIAQLVDRLRDLAASEVSASRGPVDLNRLLHELSLLQRTTGEAAIDLDLDPSLPPVDGDRDQLARLFLNLLRNAIEAAAKRVHVVTRVETGRRWRDPAGKLHALVTAAVEDDGPGIAPAVREHLFEPFVTTKASGTGLGLAAALRIAQQHAGTIAVEAPAGGGSGARFVVTLPASLASASAWEGA